MYTEFQLKSRESFKFGFTGAELVPYVENLLKSFQTEEDNLRKELSVIMNDRTQSVNSEETNKKKKRLEFVATEVEKCAVWQFTFTREKDRIFNLEIGDVVYFKIAG